MFGFENPVCLWGLAAALLPFHPFFLSDYVIASPRRFAFPLAPFFEEIVQRVRGESRRRRILLAAIRSSLLFFLILFAAAPFYRPTNDSEEREKKAKSDGPPQILLVDGSETDSAEGRSAADYFALALDLSPDASDRLTPGIRRISGDELVGYSASRLASFDAVLAVDLVAPLADETRPLTDYLRGGGRLLLVLGARTEPEAWNRLFFRTILPGWRLGAKTKSTGTKGNFDHPILAPFVGRKNSGLDRLAVDSFFPLEPNGAATESAVRPILSDAQTNRPLLAEIVSPTERGRLFLWTTAPERSMGTFYLDPAFLPLVDRTVYGAVGEKNVDSEGTTEFSPARPLIPTSLFALIVALLFMGDVIISAAKQRKPVPFKFSRRPG